MRVKLTVCQTRNLNTSSQLASPQQPISGALPTMLAGKLCKRAHDYMCDAFEPYKFDRPKSLKGHYKMGDEYTAEERIVEEVWAGLEDKQNPHRRQPWKKELDETIFYL